MGYDYLTASKALSQNYSITEEQFPKSISDRERADQKWSARALINSILTATFIGRSQRLNIRLVRIYSPPTRCHLINNQFIELEARVTSGVITTRGAGTAGQLQTPLAPLHNNCSLLTSNAQSAAMSVGRISA